LLTEVIEQRGRDDLQPDNKPPPTGSDAMIARGGSQTFDKLINGSCRQAPVKKVGAFVTFRCILYLTVSN
jgi:hypothetical protein